MNLFKEFHLFTRKNIIIVLVVLLLFGSCYKFFFVPTTQICCVGDSLTYGSGVGKNRKTDSYPAQLKALLGKGYEVTNYGLRNATASFAGDLPYVESEEYDRSISAAKKSKAVILMLGTNDTKTYNWDPEKYEAGLVELIDEYQNLKNHPTVYIMRSPYVFAEDGGDIAKYEIQPSVVSGELGDIIEKVANEKGIECINLYEVTEGKNELYTDGIHFTKDGYALIANTIYETIKNEL